MKKNFVLLVVCLASLKAIGQDAENVFLITLDGMRWQEVFGGAVDSMMANKEICEDSSLVFELYHDNDLKIARKKLMPFFWDSIAAKGFILGNRTLGSTVDVTNRFWFSYPGYGEILTGYSDPRISSNAKINNPDTTVLEWLHMKPEFKGKIAAFGSWDVFDYIINEERSGIPVNCGYEAASGKKLTAAEKMTNRMQQEVPKKWGSVRFDAFTHQFMMEYVRQHHPRVVYISYGETDDFAHDGEYDQYLHSARRSDDFIHELWNFIQSDPQYRGKTSLVITTDHGRGHSPMTEWKNHGTKTSDSNQIWIAGLGAGISAKGEVSGGKRSFQNQVAATVAQLLGYDFTVFNQEIGPALENIK